LWYEDTTGLVLDFCVPNAAQLAAGTCLILPADVPNPTSTIQFPGNFPEEAFYWNAGAIINFPAGGRATLGLQLEGAFANGAVVINEQITFGRIRIIVDAPPGTSGTYTVTHPFGVEIFPGVVAGKRAITFTSDIGIGAPGDFTGALQSGIGPFLRPAVTEGGTAKAPVNLNGGLFLSDAVALEFVTGSPFGTNYFEVCAPSGQNIGGPPGSPNCIRINQFTVMGKVHAGAVGSPLTVTEATYSRGGTTPAHVDVFATATPEPGAAAPLLSLGDAAGTNMPAVLMAGPTQTLAQFYGQGVLPTPANLPAAIIVTNIADIPPNSVTHKLTDQVTITEASYAPGTCPNPTTGGVLTITATSSDKLVPPQLNAVGLPGSLTGSDPLNAAGSLTYNVPCIPAPGQPPAVPPVTVTVISEAGGHATREVVTSQGGTFAAGAPVAVDDTVSTTAGTPLPPIQVLANDRNADALTPVTAAQATVHLVTLPAKGTAVVQSDGTVLYTPTNPALVGEDTFTYNLVPGTIPHPSNVATVTVITTAAAGGAAPIAVNDGPFSVSVSTALTLTVGTVVPPNGLLGNDNPNGTTIDPASFALGAATGGTVALLSNPARVVFTAGAVAGPGSFTYTIANTNGARSAVPATVSITINAAADNLVITSARYRTLTLRWDVVGTSTVPGPGNTVTVVLVRGTTVVGTVGTATVDAAGGWSVRVLNTPAAIRALPGDRVQVSSTAGGGVRTPPGGFTVTITN